MSDISTPPGTVACRMCGASVASSASTCPACGAKTPSLSDHRIKSVFFALVFVALAVLFLAIPFQKPDASWIAKTIAVVVGLFLALAAILGFRSAKTGKDPD